MIKGHTKKCRETWRAVAGGSYCEIHKTFIDQEEEFISDMEQIFKNEGKTCLYCRHLKDLFDSSCLAFPSVIPCPLLTGMERHKKPWAQQKNKIVFSPRVFKCPLKTKYPKCPNCKNSKSVIPIVYGYPTTSTMKKAEKKLVWLGGCCITNSDPAYFCRACEKEFGRIKRTGLRV